MKRITYFLVIAILLLAVAVNAEPKLLKVESDSAAEAYLSLGNHLYNNGATDGAEFAYRKSIEFQDNEMARHNLGVLYNFLNDTEKAEIEFLTSVDLNNEYSKGHNSLGLLYFHKDDLEQAIKHFRVAARLDPENPQINFDLGVSLANNYRQGNGELIDLTEALKHFQKTHELDAKYPNVAGNIEVIEKILDYYNQ